VDYERGLRVPKSGPLSRIAGAADTPMDWLLNDRTPKMRPDDRDWDTARPFRAIWRDPTHPAGADDDPHIMFQGSVRSSKGPADRAGSAWTAAASTGSRPWRWTASSGANSHEFRSRAPANVTAVVIR
jgi:hypothetical protein